MPNLKNFLFVHDSSLINDQKKPEQYNAYEANSSNIFLKSY